MAGTFAIRPKVEWETQFNLLMDIYDQGSALKTNQKIAAIMKFPFHLRQFLSVGDDLEKGGQRLSGFFPSIQIMAGIGRLKNQLWPRQLRPEGNQR